MGDTTHIEWTDATWNPVTGCTRVSPGCVNCYIDWAPPFRIEGRHFTDRDGNRSHAIGATTGVRLHPDRLDWPLRKRSWRGKRVFVCSLADLFHDDVPDEYIARVFAVMALTPEVTYQVLTAAVSAGHIGYVYQATNALYTGSGGDASYLVDLKGRRRATNQGVRLTKAQIAERGWTEVKEPPKHRYLYILGSKTQRRQRRALLRLPTLPYPKATASDEVST